MAIGLKNLAEGQLPNSKTTLYTVSASTQAIMVSASFVNTDSSARTINFYYKKSGETSRQLLMDLSLAADGGREIYKHKIMMEAGDILEGDASVASKVDYVLSGVEES